MVQVSKKLRPETRMLGIHLTEQEHTLVRELALDAGEKISVLFRNWLRQAAKAHGIALEPPKVPQKSQ
jgi:hypothetical protein